MGALKVWAVGLSAALALWLAFALAVTARAAPPPCCHAAFGQVVQIALAEPVGTKIQKAGETFAIRLAQPLIVNGRVVLRAGTMGVGAVVQSSGPGMGGKAAKLVLAARYLEGPGGRRILLQGLQLAAAGHDNTETAQAVGLTGIAFGPLGLAALAVPGGNVEFPEGTTSTARLAADVTLPSLGRATRNELDDNVAAEIGFANTQRDDGPIAVAAPPPGKAQVVFFRAKSLMGTGLWFKVREDGAELGKLSNGAYFVEITEPGVHLYTATTEPEAKDHLTLQIDPGETYFVEGTLTKGLAIGMADLSPSDRAAFDKASKSLKLASPPGATDEASNAVSNAVAAEGPGR
ncbi:MAG TPA: hypothetical protein VGL58_19810 [Caulobacteraceae bacterium]|jgi:hypothetical protein